MPGTQNHQRAAARRALSPAPSTRDVPPVGWSVDLRLIYDADIRYGWITGSAWSPDGSEVLELGAVDVADRDMHDDVISLLSALWDRRSRPRGQQ